MMTITKSTFVNLIRRGVSNELHHVHSSRPNQRRIKKIQMIRRHEHQSLLTARHSLHNMKIMLHYFSTS